MINQAWQRKTIEAVADIIHEGNSCTSWNAAKAMATAAFDTIIEQLPETKETPFISKQRREARFYQQLIALKVENDK